MIIKDIKLTNTNGVVTLSAQCKLRKIGWDEVYFAVNSQIADYVCADASPFAAALLIPSMRQGEDLIIKGSISKQLYAGMHAVMDEVLSWNIGCKRIKIVADKLVEDTLKPGKTGSFFSGGVDSFYTYLKHKNDSDPAHRVDSLILINGFEIDLRSKDLWQLTLENITAIAKAEQVELVTVESNLYKLLDPIMNWDFLHGGCLAAVGLFLRQEFGRIYVPSTFAEGSLVPWGSHPMVDKHWSTETINFVHDGTEATRVNKILWQVAKSPVALRHLRVCYMNTVGTYNCGVCPKCLRTMTALYIAGVLDQAATFPRQLDIQRIADTPAARNAGVQVFTGEEENLEALRERNLAPDLQQAILISIDKTKYAKTYSSDTIKYHVSGLLRRGIYFDHVYSHGHLYEGLSRLFGREFA